VGGREWKTRRNDFVLKSDHFNVDREPRTRLSDGAFDTADATGPLPVRGAECAAERSAHSVSDGTTESGTGSVSVTYDPAVAEIYVNGKFVGQAPATLRLSSGSHHVEVRAPGRRNWSRDLEGMKDSQISLHPVLESSP